MGMDLIRVKDGAYFRWSIHYWRAVLELAQRYGWEPICGADLQVSGIVSSEDAKAMAVALEKALPDIPSQEAIVDKTVNPQMCANIDLSAVRIGPNNVESFLTELCRHNPGMIVGGYFTPEVWDTMNCFEKLAVVKPKLEEFIAYLRAGSFQIY